MKFLNNILITGATSDLGRVISEYLYEKGYNVILVGRNASKLNAISQKLCNTLSYTCDFTDLDKISGIFKFLKNNNIKLDGLIHCVTYGKAALIKNQNSEDILEALNITYCSFVMQCKAFYKRDISNNGASIVAISSFGTMLKLKGTVGYIAPKTALETAVTIASKEFARRLIRVNAILPAYVDTKSNEKLYEIIETDKVQSYGLIEPIQIAYITEFLISDKSKYITGALIPLSAGMN